MCSALHITWQHMFCTAYNMAKFVLRHISHDNRSCNTYHTAIYVLQHISHGNMCSTPHITWQYVSCNTYHNEICVLHHISHDNVSCNTYHMAIHVLHHISHNNTSNCLKIFSSEGFWWWYITLRIEHSSLLGGDTLSLDNQFPVFQRTTVCSSSGSSCPKRILHEQLIQQHMVATQRTDSSATMLCEPHIPIHIGLIGIWTSITIQYSEQNTFRHSVRFHPQLFNPKTRAALSHLTHTACIKFTPVRSQLLQLKQN
jgi:hypothetical protein